MSINDIEECEGNAYGFLCEVIFDYKFRQIPFN